MTAGPVDLRHLSQWWTWTPSASWKHPDGPDNSIKGRADEPVVHVAYEDADAYATWAKKSLPTEAQWEHAARGGLDRATYVWGDVPRGLPERIQHERILNRKASSILAAWSFRYARSQWP
jgi:sulfatase modifying factor 1